MQSERKELLLFLCWSTFFVVFRDPSFVVCLECPSKSNTSWIPFKNRCYTVLEESSKSPLSIEDARELCKATASNADIVSVNSEEENRFLVDSYKANWQGPEDVWLGMFFDTDTDTLKWFDNSEVSYSNWTEENNEDLPLAEICAVMHIKSGHWRKLNCELSSRMEIICEASFLPSGQLAGDQNKALITALVIMFVTFVVISSTVIWFLYRRKQFSSLGYTSSEYPSAAQIPYSDEHVLLESEEREHTT